MSGASPKPVIFLAFANDRDDSVCYLRNLPNEARHLRELVEQASQGHVPQEQFEELLRQLELPETWFPTHPHRRAISPEEFKKRMQEWLRSIESNPRTLPPPPAPR